MLRKINKILSLLLCFCLLFEQSGFAQVAGELDLSGHFSRLASFFTPDKFRPLHLRYLSYDNLNNNFRLLLDKGDFNQGLSPKGTDPEEKLKEQTRTLLNYFFIGISLPNTSFWVNLRPDAEDQIIDAELAKTDVGKILLEADLQLKKDTAQFTSPETPEGREYWDKLYKKAGEIFGSENITIPTLTRPWIVPDEIIIRETTDNAYIYKATLKVMLEQDYLKGSAVYSFEDERLKTLNEYSSQLIRERIIPKLTKEVNTAKRYASLRQVYYSLILAQWFKARFYGKGGLYSYLIDKKNLANLTSTAPWSKATYFQQYQKSFKDGEYNLKEPIQTPYGQSVRSYFSGGIQLIPQETPYPQNPPTASVPIITSGPYTAMHTTKAEPKGRYLVAAGFSDASVSSPTEGKVDIELTQSVPSSLKAESQIPSSPLGAKPQGASSPMTEQHPAVSSPLPDEKYEKIEIVASWMDETGKSQPTPVLVPGMSRRGVLKGLGLLLMAAGIPGLFGGRLHAKTPPKAEVKTTINDLMVLARKNKIKVFVLRAEEFEKYAVRLGFTRRAAQTLNGMWLSVFRTHVLRDDPMILDTIAHELIHTLHSDKMKGQRIVSDMPEEDSQRLSFIAWYLEKNRGRARTRQLTSPDPTFSIDHWGRLLFEHALSESRALYELLMKAFRHVVSGEYNAKAPTTAEYAYDEIFAWIYGVAIDPHPPFFAEKEMAKIVDQVEEELKKCPDTRAFLNRYYANLNPELPKPFASSPLTEPGVASSPTQSASPVRSENLPGVVPETSNGASSPAEQPTEAVIDALKELHVRYKGFRVVTTVFEVAQTIAKAVGIKFGYEGEKTEAALFINIIIRPEGQEPAFKEHIQEYHQLYSDRINTLKQLVDQRAMLLQAIDFGGYTQEEQDAINQAFGRIKELVNFKAASSPTEDTKGGIDFRGLPIVTQPTLTANPLRGSSLRGQSPSNVNLDTEWSQIQNMLQAGIIPSSERIKEYLQSCCQEKDFIQEIDKVLGCLAEILRLEEERVSSTEPALREILVLLESDKPAPELQVALSKIEVLPQEPQLIEQ